MPQIQNIAPALFRVGSLVSASFKGPWTGEVTVKEGDVALLNLTDNKLIKKGKLVLLPHESFKKFEKVKKDAASFLHGLSKRFPIPQARLINNHEIERVDKRFHEEKFKYMTLAREYAYETYHTDREKRRGEILAQYPAFVDRIDSYYPTAPEIEAACGMSWIFFKVEDLEAYDKVMADQKVAFSNTMNSFVHEMATEFRTTAVGAALAFRKGMDRAKNKVDERVIEKFKEFLSRFEHEDFLGDIQMRDVLGRIKESVFGIEGWDVKGDKIAMDKIRAYLTEVEAIGQQEGAAADIANTFVRSVATEEVEIEATDDQTSVGAQDLNINHTLPDGVVPNEVVETVRDITLPPPVSLEIEADTHEAVEVPGDDEGAEADDEIAQERDELGGKGIDPVAPAAEPENEEVVANS